MAITTFDGLIASIKRRVTLQKTVSRTAVASVPFSVFDLAGNPGPGLLNVGNTASGIVPTNAIAGYPAMIAPSGSLYLNRFLARSSVASWLDVYDCLFSAGAYAFNADVTLAAQPSFASRLSSAGDYIGLELWMETVTAFAGSQTIQINYLDQDGAAGDTGSIATAVVPILGRMLALPLAGGDSGLQRIDRVRSSVSTVGTFNVHIMRWLWGCRINGANQGVVDTLLQTGLAKIFGETALRLVVTADSTATGLPSIRGETVDG